MNQNSTSFKIFREVLLCVLMLPLLYININSFHDWGDDFAQYILQAQHFSGEIQTIPVSDVEGYGPFRKGLLFSILLAVTSSFNHDIILAGKIVVSLSLMFCGLMFFKTLSVKFNYIAAFISTLYFVFNFHVLRLKDQVLPDLLFTGVVLAVFLLFNSGNKKSAIAALILAGLSTGLKSTGFALVATLAIAVLSGLFPALLRDKIKSLTALFLPCFIILISEFLGAQNKSGGLWYVSIIISNLDLHSVINNLLVYKNAIAMFFEQELPSWINVIIRYFVFVGLIGGLIVSFLKSDKTIAIFFSIYFIVLIVYPYSGEPVRFIVALIPLVIIFIFEFYSFIFRIAVPNKFVIPILISVALAGSQVLSTKNEIAKVNTYEPWSKATFEMKSFIRYSTNAHDTIAFYKPWALALFTGRHCIPSDVSYKANLVIYRNSIVDFDAFNRLKSEGVIYKNEEYTIQKSD